MLTQQTFTIFPGICFQGVGTLTKVPISYRNWSYMFFAYFGSNVYISWLCEVTFQRPYPHLPLMSIWLSPHQCSVELKVTNWAKDPKNQQSLCAGTSKPVLCQGLHLGEMRKTLLLNLSANLIYMKRHKAMLYRLASSQRTILEILCGASLPRMPPKDLVA